MARWYEVYRVTEGGERILAETIEYRLETELFARAMACSFGKEALTEVIVERVIVGKESSASDEEESEDADEGDDDTKGEDGEKKPKKIEGQLAKKEKSLSPGEEDRQELSTIPNLPLLEFGHLRSKVLPMCETQADLFKIETYSAYSFFLKGYMTSNSLTILEALYSKAFVDKFMADKEGMLLPLIKKVVNIQLKIYKDQIDSPKEREAFLMSAYEKHYESLGTISAADDIEVYLEGLETAGKTLESEEEKNIFLVSLSKKWSRYYYTEKLNHLCSLFEKGGKVKGFHQIANVIFAELLSHREVIEKIFTNQRDRIAHVSIALRVYDFTFVAQPWDSQLLSELWKVFSKSPLYYARAHLLRGVSEMLLREPSLTNMARQDTLEALVQILEKYPYRPLMGKVGYNELLESIFLRAMDYSDLQNGDNSPEDLIGRVLGKMKNLDSCAKCEMLFFLSTSRNFKKLLPSVVKAVARLLLHSRGLGDFCAFSVDFSEKKRRFLALQGLFRKFPASVPYSQGLLKKFDEVLKKSESAQV